MALLDSIVDGQHLEYLGDPIPGSLRRGQILLVVTHTANTWHLEGVYGDAYDVNETQLIESTWRLTGVRADRDTLDAARDRFVQRWFGRQLSPEVDTVFIRTNVPMPTPEPIPVGITVKVIAHVEFACYIVEEGGRTQYKVPIGAMTDQYFTSQT